MRSKYFSITADRVICPARITKAIREFSLETGIKIKRAKLGDASNCVAACIAPSVALENEEIRIALAEKNDDLVRRLLEEEF